MTPPQDRTRSDAQEHAFGSELSSTQPSPEHVTYDDLQHVKLSVTAHLGEARMTVREVLTLRRGSVIALDKVAGEMADIQVNDIPIARGEVVVLGDLLHVRVAEVQGVEREQPLNE